MVVRIRNIQKGEFDIVFLMFCMMSMMIILVMMILLMIRSMYLSITHYRQDYIYIYGVVNKIKIQLNIKGEGDYLQSDIIHQIYNQSMSQLCQFQILLNARTVLLNSAHGMFQYGQYYQCLEQQGYSYNLVQLGYGDVNAGIYFGFCLPQICTKDVIQSELSKLLVQMQAPYNIHAIFNDIQDYQFPFNWVFYTTITILSLLFVITLYATLFKTNNKIIKSVSLQQTMKVFKSKDSDLNVFNGVRALAMMWVVFGHYYFNTVTGILNALDIQNIFQKPFLLLVQAGLLSVDVFFFLGGFFLAFVFMRQKNTTYKTYILAILQRMLRILPAYILTMMFYYSILMHLGEGPRWPFYQPVIMICSSMWRSIFFVENLINNGEQMCLDWGWYLQVDFQIFIVCIILLFIYRKINKVGSYVTAAALIIGSWFFNVYYTYVHKQRLITDVSSLMNFRDYYLDVYIKPYARWAPYIIGLYLGIAYFQFQQYVKNQRIYNKKVTFLTNLKDRFENRRIFRIAFEWSGMALMAFIVFIPRTLQTGHKWDQIWHSLFGCFQKTLFILGMLMVIFPTILGCKSSLFKLLLDNSLFNFIAKISFCTYLVHLMVIIQYYNSRTYDYYYFLVDAFPLYLGCLAVSCGLGFIMTIFVQIPFSVWQKEIMKKLMKRQKTQLQQKEENGSMIEKEIMINKSINQVQQKA